MIVNTLFGQVELDGESQACIKCGVTKPIEMFATRYSGNNGKCEYRNDCKECQGKGSKQVAKLRKMYPPPDINTFRCPCCKRSREEMPGYKNNPKNNNPFVLDHDHEDGHFRGYICNYCNVGLSRFFENIEAMENAIKYLKNGGDLEQMHPKNSLQEFI